MSYGAVHPWEGRDPGKYGMFTVVLYCFVMDSFFFFFADKPISPGWVASLCSLPACLSRFNTKQQKKKNKKQKHSSVTPQKKTLQNINDWNILIWKFWSILKI